MHGKTPNVHSPKHRLHGRHGSAESVGRSNSRAPPRCFWSPS